METDVTRPETHGRTMWSVLSRTHTTPAGFLPAQLQSSHENTSDSPTPRATPQNTRPALFESAQVMKDEEKMRSGIC